MTAAMRSDNLFTPDRKIAILAGAGISMDSPSDLSDEWTFMKKALLYACPPISDFIFPWDDFPPGRFHPSGKPSSARAP
jgi:hypothetical protein